MSKTKKREQIRSKSKSKNGVIITPGMIIQEFGDKYIGIVSAVDGASLLYHPFGGQEISSTGYANCDECIVLAEPQMPPGHGINENRISEYNHHMTEQYGPGAEELGGG